MVFRGELIGSNVEVVYSNNIALIGTRGRMTDKTKNRIILNNKKMIDKNNVKIMVTERNKLFVIDGKSLVARPEDRLKRVKNE